ncbi:hypothetical protein [Limnohabitans sp.]|uniref:hypothetical protein n=1 Tax=Limnohabitans sp. TaxID=1907725 RepID=UPI00286ECF73|nr:hypothetical protein [Limnohabitans sp.]
MFALLSQLLGPLHDELLFAVVYMWLFYVFYVLIMAVYRAKLAGRLGGLSLLLLYPFVVVGVLMDVLCQLTIASLIFFEPPRTCWQATTVTVWRWSFEVTYLYIEPLVTTRLKRLHTSDMGWRTALAAYICQNLLDPFDPDGDHC